MRTFVFLATATSALLALALATSPAKASIDEKLAEELKQVAAALEKGDDAIAKTLAGKIAKKIDDIDEVMTAFKLRTKKGLGVGSVAGVAQPDGIDHKLSALERDGITPAALAKEGKALSEAAFICAAVAEVALLKVPEKDGSGKKADKKLWNDTSKAMRAEAILLAKAASSGAAAEVKNAATKLANACNSCHKEFK